MEAATRTPFSCLLLIFLYFSPIRCLDNNNNVFDESLDAAILHDMIPRRPHTGVLYNATLPANLAGMNVSTIGLRSTTLWRNGANFSDIIVIPPGTLPVPHVKRLLIVYHNLNNLSASYYSLPGYTLASPVIGFFAYDATHWRSKNNLSKVELNTMGKPIHIKFPDYSDTISNHKTTTKYCACFGAASRRVTEIDEMRSPRVCDSRGSQGHFSVVIPVIKKKAAAKKIWPFWIMGFLAGFVGLLILVGLAGAVAVRSLVGGKRRRRTTQEMEKEADEGECLQTHWIDASSSKMPLAEVTRTQPVLESTTSLPNPKLSWYA